MKKIIAILLTITILISVTSCTPKSSDILAENQSQVRSQEGLDETLSTQTIVFPVSDAEKTENNAFIFDIEPFKLSMELPKDWTIKERSDDTKLFPLIGVWSVMDIFNQNVKHIGSIGYTVYEEYEGAQEIPQAIYNQIALGNGYSFDAQTQKNGGKYIPISEKENGVTAITEVYYAPYLAKELGYEEKERYNKGILSYNKDLLVYIACEFEADCMSEDLLKSIAESINIESAK